MLGTRGRLFRPRVPHTYFQLKTNEDGIVDWSGVSLKYSIMNLSNPETRTMTDFDKWRMAYKWDSVS